MVNKVLITGFCILFCWFIASGQIELNELEQEVEAITEVAGEDADVIQWAENLDYFRDHKINLNTAGKELLSQLGFLNAFQIFNLLEHRRKYGRIVTFYELGYLNGFDESVIKKLETFTYLGEVEPRKFSLKEMLTRGRHLTVMRVQLGLEERRGYLLRRQVRAGDTTIGSYYLGDPSRVFIRHRYTFGNQLSFGFTGEKDPGEPILWEAGQRGFDFYSGHIALMGKKRLKSLIIGDYQAQFGQGLVLWSSLAFRKSPSVLNVQRFGRGFIPYNGLDENRFFRGGALTYTFKNIDLSAFYSLKRMSSALSETIIDEDTGETIVEGGSLRLTGLHRTPTERAARKTLSMESVGTHATGDFGFFRIGATAVQHRFDPPLASPTPLYQQFNIQGRNIWNASLDYQVLLPSIQLFGEMAINQAGGLAMTHGAYVSAGSKLTYVLFYRHFQKEYSAIFHAPFAESTGNDAERGFYTGFRWEAAPRLFINAYADLYQFDWPRFSASLPTTGRDVFIQGEYFLSRRYNFYLRLREEVNQINGPDETVIRPLAEQKRYIMRWHQNIFPNNRIHLASRIEFSRAESHKGLSRGWLVFQDIRFSLPKTPLKITYRLSVYDTDDFDSRIYAFENDVLYSFSVPALYDRGTRSYVMAEYSYKRLTFWVRYAITRFTDRYIISSGLQQIDGNIASDIRVQCRLKL